MALSQLLLPQRQKLHPHRLHRHHQLDAIEAAEPMATSKLNADTPLCPNCQLPMVRIGSLPGSAIDRVSKYFAALAATPSSPANSDGARVTSGDGLLPLTPRCHLRAGLLQTDIVDRLRRPVVGVSRSATTAAFLVLLTAGSCCWSPRGGRSATAERGFTAFARLARGSCFVGPGNALDPATHQNRPVP